jgi:hypothetical protein
MAVADDLERQRAALTMIHAQPFNAEAPPEALEGDITPTARSRSPARSRTPLRSQSTIFGHCRQSSASSRSNAPGTVDSR